MPMFRLKAGRYARFENGIRRDYQPGDVLELDRREQEKLKDLIEPIEPPPPARIKRSAPSWR